MSKILDNGIELPDVWPPDDVDLDCSEPQRVPYLEKIPEVISIDNGRQLFVDDFLIDWNVNMLNHMVRNFHTPVKYTGNPVLFPQTDDELNLENSPCAVAKSGGVWWDGYDQIFKMWYMSSYLGYVSYAFSPDGIHWERPELDVVPGTNHVLPRDIHPDSGSVIIDYDTDNPEERYKMLLREPDPLASSPKPHHYNAWMMTSPDGIHWKKVGKTGDMGDRSTMFYNPFRKKWVQSVRSSSKKAGRIRRYNEDCEFLKSGEWDFDANLRPWLRADKLDKGIYGAPQLYNFDAIAYESLMIGFPQILKGPANEYGEPVGMPKLTELTVAFSRDGFYWDRPCRSAFIPAARRTGSWEYGYVESSAGMIHIVGDELWIYYSAYAGDTSRKSADVSSWYYNGMYANGAVGLAKLRRDGFASIDARYEGGAFETRPVSFSGSFLFINANTVGSNFKVEVLDINKEVIEGFSKDECIGFIGNSTCAGISWKNASLASLVGHPVSFRFLMDRGSIYSFWVSKSEDGKSGGYNAAGGPGFSGARDL